MSAVRDRMIAGTVQLLASKGLQGASFGEVLALTGAPRGSIYHHFPGGKDELVSAALAAVATTMAERIDSFEADPVAVTEGFLSVWSELLTQGQLGVGCAVAAVSVAGDGDVLGDAGEVFRGWTAQLAAAYRAGGVDSQLSVAFAALVISAVEGAVIMSRAEGSREPFDLAAGLLITQARGLTA